MKVIPTKLCHENIEMITFLPVDNRVREGTLISLKGDSRRWEVMKQYMQQDIESINRVWGLDLPKSQRTEK